MCTVYVLRCVLGGYAQVGRAGGTGGAEEDGTAAGRSGPDDGGAYICVCMHLFLVILWTTRSAVSSKLSRDT